MDTARVRLAALARNDRPARRAVGDRIFYEDATATPYLEQTLRATAARSPTGKVTLIAHSYGGLVAKALLLKLGPDAAKLVDKVVLIAAPQSGASEDVALMLHGYGGALPFDSCATLPLIGSLCGDLIDRSAARSFAEHAPLAYHLLPSTAYFRTVSDGTHHVVEFNATHAFAAERGAYHSGINTQPELYSFLQALEGGRTRPAAADLAHADVLTEPALLAEASSTHERLDAWTPPIGMAAYQIAAVGVSTLSGIDYDDYALLGNAGTRSLYRPIFTQEGDGTVQSQSVMQMKPSSRIHDTWVDLAKVAHVPGQGYDHANILEAAPVSDLVRSILLDETASSSPALASSRPASTTYADRFVLVLHSPLTFQATDSHGNRAGIDANGTYRNEIPDAEYGAFGDTQYIVLPIAAYTLQMQGIGNGTFTLDVERMSHDVIASRTTFAELPVSLGTHATLSLGPASISALTVSPGAGGSSISLSPKIGTSVQFAPKSPTSVPSTSRSSSGGSSGGSSKSKTTPSVTSPPPASPPSSASTSTPSTSTATSSESSLPTATTTVPLSPGTEATGTIATTSTSPASSGPAGTGTATSTTEHAHAVAQKFLRAIARAVFGAQAYAAQSASSSSSTTATQKETFARILDAIYQILSKLLALVTQTPRYLHH